MALMDRDYMNGNGIDDERVTRNLAYLASRRKEVQKKKELNKIEEDNMKNRLSSLLASQE